MIPGREVADPRRAKYHCVAGALRKSIYDGKYARGNSLPTMKQIAAEFDVSFVTAFRAVRVLADEGLISTTRRRKGAIVLRDRPHDAVRSTTITCLLRPARERDSMDNFGLDIIEGLHDEISSRGYRFIHHALNETDYARRIRESVTESNACGLLLDQKTPHPTVVELARLGVPIVIFNRFDSTPGVCSVVPDYTAVGEESARFLASRGYHRLGFYKMPMDESSWDAARAAEYYPLVEMREGFVATARTLGFHGKRVVLLDEKPARGPDPQPEIFGLPDRKGAGWTPLGILAANDHNAVQMLQAISRTDLVVGKDIGIIGCYDMECGQRATLPPTTWRIAGRAVGATVVRELLARVENPASPVSVVRLKPEFVDRGTA